MRSRFASWFVLAALACPAVAVAAAAPPELLEVASCPRQAAEYRATITHRILLHRAFLDGKTDDDTLRASIRHQLKYLWGYFRTDAAARAKDRVVLSADDPEILIKSKREVPYGRDLVIDWDHKEPNLQITDGYTARAVARGTVAAADPALLVDYEIHFTVAICGEPRAADSVLDVRLPLDPWLVYWHVPRAAHRLMRYFDESAVTNPCSDDDFADLPLPFYYWYDWQVDRHGPDGDGKPFDCRALLRPDVDFFTRPMHLARTSSPAPRFEVLRRALADRATPLRATVLIGVLDHAWKDLGYEQIRRALDAGQPPARPSLASRVAKVLGGTTPIERGTGKFLALLADLARVMKVASYHVTVEDDYLAVLLEGRLARSDRPIQLRAYVGLTDVFGFTPPRHWRILRDALAHDNVVVYAGHSGLGENFRLANIEEKLALEHKAVAAELDRVPFQLVAFLSCYSYMYFGHDLVAATARPNREFVYTGTEFTRGDRGALAILDLVDQALASPTAPPRLKYVDPEDFLIIKGVPTTSTH